MTKTSRNTTALEREIRSVKNDAIPTCRGVILNYISDIGDNWLLWRTSANHAMAMSDEMFASLWAKNAEELNSALYHELGYRYKSTPEDRLAEDNQNERAAVTSLLYSELIKTYTKAYPKARIVE